jgi:hypothetical protein
VSDILTITYCHIHQLSQFILRNLLRQMSGQRQHSREGAFERISVWFELGYALAIGRA